MRDEVSGDALKIQGDSKSAVHLVTDNGFLCEDETRIIFHSTRDYERKNNLAELTRWHIYIAVHNRKSSMISISTVRACQQGIGTPGQVHVY